MKRRRKHPGRPPSARRRGEPPSPRTRFQMAMVATALEDARSAPCFLCGAPPAVAGIWFPTASCSRRLGAAEGKTRVVVYSLCEACHASGGPDRIEEMLLAEADNQRQIRDAGWKTDGHLATPTDAPPVPEWVRDALGTLEAQCGREVMSTAIFAWDEDVPCVFVRSRDGTCHTLAPSGVEPPDPPAFLYDGRIDPPTC